MNGLQQILDILMDMTNEERKEIFDKIASRYCLYCGKDESDGHCHCMNDD